MNRPLLFLLFFGSGFSGLVYQVVWTRIAFASFGIITPVLSVVLSVFMLGLSLGAWAGGKWILPATKRTKLSAVHFYALAEFMIGIGAFTVPRLFALGERLLLGMGQSDSATYLAASSLVIVGSMLPWCFCMGTTFPLMMAYIRERESASQESFSFLYLANVLGAAAGTLCTGLVLVELLGFRNTLLAGALVNFLIVAVCLLNGGKGKEISVTSVPGGSVAEITFESPPFLPVPRGKLFAYWILFSTGFASMAMEVVWTRSFATVLKTQVYSFALIVAVYLLATFAGSLAYRRDLRLSQVRPTGSLLFLLATAAFLPILLNDARFNYVHLDKAYMDPAGACVLLASIFPVCLVLGYLTPNLVDFCSGGSPSRAGSAYAVNVMGCILGPLFASYLLLPLVNERNALLMLAMPFILFCMLSWKSLSSKTRMLLGIPALALLTISILYTRSFEEHVLASSPHTAFRRDYAASVISYGQGLEKRLLVNGIGMTKLTPVTKFMAHLPLAFHEDKPQSALIICFGMGTTFRSALSWDVETTAVELVPGVAASFGFYNDDAESYRSNPRGHIIVDDGRRFLNRTKESYDVIIVDPPPPVEAAGSSLLYSKEFYELAKQHLKPHGIVQAWIPADETVGYAALRSVSECFNSVRAYPSIEGWGLHVLASMDSIQSCDGKQLASRMPEKARADLLEWSSNVQLPAYFDKVLANGGAIDEIMNTSPLTRITDDRPFNEYFLLRQIGLNRNARQ